MQRKRLRKLMFAAMHPQIPMTEPVRALALERLRHMKPKLLRLAAARARCVRKMNTRLRQEAARSRNRERQRARAKLA